MVRKFFCFVLFITVWIGLIPAGAVAHEPRMIDVVAEEVLPDMIVAATPFEGELDARMGKPFVAFISKFGDDQLVRSPVMIILLTPGKKSLFALRTEADSPLPPGVERHELPGGKILSILHRGPSDFLSDAYQRILEYQQAHGLRLDKKRPVRHVYLTDVRTTDIDNQLIELQVPIQ